MMDPREQLNLSLELKPALTRTQLLPLDRDYRPIRKNSSIDLKQEKEVDQKWLVN